MIMQLSRPYEPNRKGKCPYRTMCENGANFADTEKVFGNCVECGGFGYFFDFIIGEDLACKNYGKIMQAREQVKKQVAAKLTVKSLPLIKAKETA